MLRQKYSTAMLMAQVAVTLAILSNGLFIISERYQAITHPSGMDEANTFVLTSSGFTDNFNPQTSIQEDLAELRTMPNIIDVVATNTFPYSGTGIFYNLQVQTGDNQNKISTANYKLDHHGIKAMGLTLIAGTNFNANEVIWQTPNDTYWPSQVILTESVAKNLFNSTDWGSIVGKTIFIENNHSVIIKGVVEQLQSPWGESGQMEHSFISPAVVAQNSTRYIIRVKDGYLNNTMLDVEQYLATSNRERMIRKVFSIQAIKKSVYGPDLAAITILLVVLIALIFIAAMGIAGLTSFNVLKRYKQIGIRRALGANKMDILRYFMIENLIQTSVGIILGSILAVALNIFLVEQYTLNKLPSFYVFSGVLIMYLLGMVACAKPVLRAINISPALATRTN
ncbi:MAG: putative ABC transport system permease protein [Paraglaciecola sp.]|jgi:putative ABC transport system permease protein